MLLVAKVKSSGANGETPTPVGTILLLEVDLPQAVSGRLDIALMALRYRVSKKTVERWVEKKLVPYFRIGSNTYFKEADLDAMEEAVKSQARGTVPVAIRFRAAERPHRNERLAA